MLRSDIIVIGASAGGVDALPRLIGSLPADLPAALFVVLHIPAQGRDLLPEIIRRAASLSVAHAVDGERVRQGHVYVAPPDHHMQLDGRRVRLSRGPRENFHRPAIDALFRTAAECYGPRVVGVVLTGNLDDGTAGLHAVKSRGGIAIVQDPKDASVPAMPQSALRNVKRGSLRALVKNRPAAGSIGHDARHPQEPERSLPYGETVHASERNGKRIRPADVFRLS